MSHTIRRGASRVGRIVAGVGPQSPEVAAAQREKKQAVNDNLSAGLTSGRWIEFGKNFMATRPGRSVIGLLAVGAVAVPVAQKSGLIESSVSFGVGLVQAITPERLEPSNYCHNGSGLFGVLDFNYTGDTKSAPGDCDYAQTTLTESSVPAESSPGSATITIPSDIVADPANPSVQSPNDAPSVSPSSEISPVVASVEAEPGDSAWSLSRECLGGTTEQPIPDSIVKEYVNTFFVPVNGELIMADQVYSCPN
jgi:hypothetical protein